MSVLIQSCLAMNPPTPPGQSIKRFSWDCYVRQWTDASWGHSASISIHAPHLCPPYLQHRPPSIWRIFDWFTPPGILLHVSCLVEPNAFKKLTYQGFPSRSKCTNLMNCAKLCINEWIYIYSNRWICFLKAFYLHNLNLNLNLQLVLSGTASLQILI